MSSPNIYYRANLINTKTATPSHRTDRYFHVFNLFYFVSILYVTKPKESRYLTTNDSLLGRASICHRKAKKAATE